MRAVAFGFRQRNRMPFVAIKAELCGKERGRFRKHGGQAQCSVIRINQESVVIMEILCKNRLSSAIVTV
jgi:hypothetical protein